MGTAKSLENNNFNVVLGHEFCCNCTVHLKNLSESPEETADGDYIHEENLDISKEPITSP